VYIIYCKFWFISYYCTFSLCMNNLHLHTRHAGKRLYIVRNVSQKHFFELINFQIIQWNQIVYYNKYQMVLTIHKIILIIKWYNVNYKFITYFDCWDYSLQIISITCGKWIFNSHFPMCLLAKQNKTLYSCTQWKHNEGYMKQHKQTFSIKPQPNNTISH